MSGATAGGAVCKGPRTAEDIQAMPTGELLSAYRRGVEQFDRRIFWLAPEQIDQAFLPEAGVGRWPIRVLMGHVADAELVNIHRMRRAYGEDNPVVALWDENAFIDSNIYGNAPGSVRGDERTTHPLAGHIALVHLLRQWGADWLTTLSPEAWERKLLHPERGPMTIRRVAALNMWHLEHHARFLRLKLDAMGVEAPIGQPAAEGGGSCGSGCGCGTGGEKGVASRES